MIIIALWLKLAPMYNRVQVLATVVPQAAPAAAARVVRARAHLLIRIRIRISQEMKTIIKRRRSSRQNS